MGLSQEEADSLWLRLGASGIDACLQGEGAEERLSLLRLSFAHPERLDRYQAELARSPETSPEEAVVRVNIGLDAPPYGVGGAGGRARLPHRSGKQVPPPAGGLCS